MVSGTDSSNDGSSDAHNDAARRDANSVKSCENYSPIRKDLDASSVTRTPPTATHRCPTCGTSNATFSKSQKKKPRLERKCKACVADVAKRGGSAPPPSERNGREKREKRQGKEDHKQGKNDHKIGDGREEEAGEGGDDSAAPQQLRIESNGGSKNDRANDNGGVKKSKRRNGDDKKTPLGDGDSQHGNSRSSDDRNGAPDDDREEVSENDAEAGNWSPTLAQTDEEGDVNEEGREQEPEQLRGHCLEDTPHDQSGRLKDSPAKKESSDNAAKFQPGQNLRSRMERARDQGLGKSQHVQNDGDEEEQEVSLEALKHKIIGRSIGSMYDGEGDERNPRLSSSPSSKCRPPTSSPLAASTAAGIASRLRQDLTCPICHDILFRPASLLCGHSFCEKCLNWWLDRRGTRAASDEDEGNGEAGAAALRGTCPTCRMPIANGDGNGGATRGDRPDICTNTALAAVLEVLYGAETHQRRIAEERERRKARGGERGGMHTRGCEEVVPLPREDDEELLVGSSQRGGLENGWIPLHSSADDRPGWRPGAGRYTHDDGGSTKIFIRRNIVLDDSDQRYQLSLGLTKCTYSNDGHRHDKASTSHDKQRPAGVAAVAGGVLDVELCLLSMEEDEVDDSGFPAFVQDGDDDEALICTGGDRVHTCIEASARVVPASAPPSKNDAQAPAPFGATLVASEKENVAHDVPLSRGMIGPDGAARFRIDLKKALDDNLALNETAGGRGGDASARFRIVKLRFRHAETGAALELRLPSSAGSAAPRGRGGGRQGSDGDVVEFCGARKSAAARSDPSRYLLDNFDGDNDEELYDDNGRNEYEEDGFLVNGTQDSEEEFRSGDEEEDEEEDICHICKSGGELIVCDGGSQGGGCGLACHVHCLGRRVIPPGDWICSTCAKDLGINVGIEGHEWPVEVGSDEEDIEATRNKPLTIVDSDDEEVVPVQHKRRQKRKILEVLDSDSDGSLS